MQKPSSSPPAPAADGGWASLAITLSIQAIVAMALLAVPAIAPRVAAGLGVPAGYVGFYIAIAYAGALVSGLAAGAAVGRFGAIRVSQIGLLFCAAGLALSAVASLWTVLAGAVLIGFGYGPVTPASSHLLARTTAPHRISLVFSIKQTGVPLGAALAGAIMPALQAAVGWQAALLVVAAASGVCVVLAQTLRAAFDADCDPSRRLHFGGLLQPVMLLMAIPAARRLAACSCVFTIAQLSFTTYLVTYLTESLAYGLVAAGAMLTVGQVGAVIGRIALGYMADRWWGARRVLAGLGVVMMAAALATALLDPAWPRALVAAVLFVFGASAIGWNGVYLAEVARIAPPGQVSLVTAGTIGVTFTTIIVGPLLFGAVSGLFDSYRAGFLALVLPLAVSAAVLWRR